MYKIQLDSLVSFQNYLNSAESDWVSLYVKNDSVAFIMSTSEVATLYYASCMSSDGASDSELFRVKRAVLKNCVKSQVIYLESLNDRVIIKTVSQAGTLTEVNTAKHAEYLNNVQRYLLVAQRMSAIQCFNAMPVKALMSIAKLYNSYLEVSTSVGCVTARDTTRVFCEVKGIPDLALTPAGASMLFKCNYQWAVMENYVCAKENSFVVIVTQCRSSGSASDYFDIISAGGSAMESSVDFSDIVSTATRLKEPVIDYYFRDNKCEITSNDDIYTVSVPTTKMVVAEKFTTQSLRLNTKIICGLLSKLSSTTVSISIKKYFNLMRVDGMIIVFK